MTCMVLNFIGWLFFLKNPDSEKHRTAFTPLCASQRPVLFSTRTLTDIMHFQVHETYCAHRIDSEVTANPRFSASKISRLATQKPCACHACPTSPVQGCDLCGPAHATHMQHTHATHMQHDMQHEPFPCKFTVNVQDLTFPAQPQS